jgi:hypothetical protein
MKNMKLSLILKIFQVTFLQDQKVVSDLHVFESVHQLEQGLRTQCDIDNAYQALCNTIKNDMHDKMSCKRFVLNRSHMNKQRRVGKP